MGLDLNRKTYFLVTGASRGIGKGMAIEVSSKLKAGSVIVLLARNMEGLQNTKTEIESRRADVTVLTYSVDMSTAKEDQFAKVLKESLTQSKTDANSFERAFVLHNAGTVGDVSKKAIDVSSTEAWTQYFYVNVVTTIALNVEFFKVFKQVPKLVVNQSSKCAVEPFASMSFYCSGKAARDMYFGVLAAEQADNKDVLVLNYAPGAIDTDMTVYVQNEIANKEVRESFKQQRETKTMLTVEMTSAKLIKVLEGDFKSGAHIDYWD